MNLWGRCGWWGGCRAWCKPQCVGSRGAASQYKLRKLFSMKNCKTVTSLSCVNQFFSFLTLLSCSDRSVRVLDLNQGTVVREIPHCHARQVQPDVLQLQHCNWWISDGGDCWSGFFFEKLACFEYSRNIRLCPGSHHHPGRSQRGPLTPGQRLRPCHHLVAEERVKTKPQIQNIAGITPPWHNPRGRILWRCGPMIGSNSGTATEDLNYLMSSLKD